jgi:hypothetical protein
MQRGPRRLRDARPQSAEAVIEGRQRMPAESNHDGLLLHVEHRGVRVPRHGDRPGSIASAI